MVTEKQLANLEKGKRTQFKKGEKQARSGQKGGIATGTAEKFKSAG